MGSINRHGTKWRVRWTDADGVRRSSVHDEHTTARTELAKRETEVEEVRRGLRRRIDEGHSFEELSNYWLTVRAVDKRSLADDESILRAHLSPTFDGIKLKDISTEMVDRFVAARRHLDPKTVNNHLTLLRTMMNVALDLGWLAHAPRFKKPKVLTPGFSYLRNEHEITRFLDCASRTEGEQPHALFAFAIYTGMRAGELAGLQWSDIDVSKRLITVQRSFDGPTKSGAVRYVPILDVLVPILHRWRAQQSSTFVFTSRNGTPLAPSSRVFQEVLHRVLAAAPFPTIVKKGKQKPYIVFHDLRHTFASLWVSRGGDLFKLQRILGHASQTMTQRYAHLAPSAFGAELGLFSAPSAKVLKLPDTTTSNAVACR